MENEIKIVDVKIPFWSLVKIMTKCVFAMIPVMLFLYAIGLASVALMMTIAQMPK